MSLAALVEDDQAQVISKKGISKVKRVIKLRKFHVEGLGKGRDRAGNVVRLQPAATYAGEMGNPRAGRGVVGGDNAGTLEGWSFVAVP